MGLQGWLEIGGMSATGTSAAASVITACSDRDPRGDDAMSSAIGRLSRAVMVAS